MAYGLHLHDGPETRRVLRAGQQAALPTILSHGRLHLVAFDCMKRLPAAYMLERAREERRLQPCQVVIDTSSGTFAIGLAEACEGRHPCIIVTDRAVDDDVKAALEARGCRVEIIDAPADGANLQSLRKQLRDRLARGLGAFVPDQYDNPHNPASYRAVAEIITAKLGPVDILVATVGSGGSSQGIGRALRGVNPALRIVAVNTQNSIIFGLQPGPRRLRGLARNPIISLPRLGRVGSSSLVARSGPMANEFWMSDRQWAVLEPLIPMGRRGVKPRRNREVISGIVHILKVGCRWRDCPQVYGPHTTIYNRLALLVLVIGVWYPPAIGRGLDGYE